MEAVNPAFVSGAIRFITSDVALVEGVYLDKAARGTQTTPLLFIVRKEGETWRIAAAHICVLK